MTPARMLRLPTLLKSASWLLLPTAPPRLPSPSDHPTLTHHKDTTTMHARFANAYAAHLARATPFSERLALIARIASLKADTNDIRFSKWSRENTGRLLRAAQRELDELPAPATCPVPHRQAA
jgi:hypothetical protein